MKQQFRRGLDRGPPHRKFFYKNRNEYKKNIFGWYTEYQMKFRKSDNVLKTRFKKIKYSEERMKFKKIFFSFVINSNFIQTPYKDVVYIFKEGKRDIRSKEKQPAGSP